MKKSSSQWHDYERAIREIKQLKKKEEELLLSFQQHWDAHAGPFIRALDNTISSLHVKRQRYHGGAFVGNDCVRLLNGRQALSDVLKPQQYYAQDGSSHVIGSHDQSRLVFGLLDRLYYLHRLYSAARPLCRHEVSCSHACQHYQCLLRINTHMCMHVVSCALLAVLCSCAFCSFPPFIRWQIFKHVHMNLEIGILSISRIKLLHLRCIF